jgi:hypothetical protein
MVRIVIGVVSLAALALAVTAQAAPKHPRGLAVERGVPAAQVAFERALGYFAPAQAERRFVKAANRDPRGATMALRDLAATFKSLSRADRRVARQILARPTDLGSGNYSAPKGNFRKTCTTNFCIHWVTTTVDAPSPTDTTPANGMPDWIDNVVDVMNEVWNQEITTMGYRKPRADKPTGGHRGGNPNTKLDIFIQDVGRPAIGVYGYCTTDDPRRSRRRDVSAYCVLDDDYSASQFPGTVGVDALKVTASHEFHHASQFAYDWKEDRALMEATATNMEADVYPTIHDNFQYFAFSPLTTPNTQDDGPWWPIDMFDAQFGNQYGDWIFYRFLSEYFGSPTHPNPARDPSINRQIWEKAAAVVGTNKGGKYSTQAIRSAIAARGGGANFDAAFAEFGWANASPANWYDEGDLYQTAGFVDRGSFGTGPGQDDDDGSLLTAGWPMYHFSNDYLLFRPTATASFIEFNVDFPTTSRGPAATVLTLNQDGSVSPTAIPLATDGTGNLTGVVFDADLVDGVVLVITNDSTRMEKCGRHSFAEQVTFACRGDALDDFVNGGFKYRVDVTGNGS